MKSSSRSKRLYEIKNKPKTKQNKKQSKCCKWSFLTSPSYTITLIAHDSLLFHSILLLICGIKWKMSYRQGGHILPSKLNRSVTAMSMCCLINSQNIAWKKSWISVSIDVWALCASIKPVSKCLYMKPSLRGLSLVYSHQACLEGSDYWAHPHQAFL